MKTRIILVLIFVLVSCESPPKKDFTFRTEPCDKSVNSYDIKSLAKLGKTEWNSKGALVIEKYVTANCAFGIKEPDYNITGNSLTLSYEIDEGSDGIRAACMCARKLIYEIPNLEKKDYTIDIKAEG